MQYINTDWNKFRENNYERYGINGGNQNMS